MARPKAFHFSWLGLVLFRLLLNSPGAQLIWESAIAQMGERRSSVLLSELHTNWVRVRASPASMYFHTEWCINLA